jgi:hypothetical protein
MALANNHALDFGTAALRDCAAHLSAEKVEPVGLETITASGHTRCLFSFLDGKKNRAPCD